jgi:subtilisin family serine protease
VGSTDASDELSFFSNYGSKTVFIAAPGSNIFSTTPGGNYESLSGTSMAAPQVSGAIALGLSVKRQLSRELFLQVLCDSAEKRLLDRSSCGRMNVSRFVRGLASL